MEPLKLNDKKLFYSIGEVAKLFNVNASLIRFWEKEFKQVKSPNLSKRIIKRKQGIRQFWSNAISNGSSQNQANEKQKNKVSKITWGVILAITAAILGILNQSMGILDKLFGG